MPQPLRRLKLRARPPARSAHGQRQEEARRSLKVAARGRQEAPEVSVPLSGEVGLAAKVFLSVKEKKGGELQEEEAEERLAPPEQLQEGRRVQEAELLGKAEPLQEEERLQAEEQLQEEGRLQEELLAQEEPLEEEELFEEENKKQR